MISTFNVLLIDAYVRVCVSVDHIYLYFVRFRRGRKKKEKKKGTRARADHPRRRERARRRVSNLSERKAEERRGSQRKLRVGLPTWNFVKSGHTGGRK